MYLQGMVQSIFCVFCKLLVWFKSTFSVRIYASFFFLMLFALNYCPEIIMLNPISHRLCGLWSLSLQSTFKAFYVFCFSGVNSSHLQSLWRPWLPVCTGIYPLVSPQYARNWFSWEVQLSGYKQSEENTDISQMIVKNANCHITVLVNCYLVAKWQMPSLRGQAW